MSLLGAVAGGPILAQQGVDCSACHDQGEKIRSSVHAGVDCATCHPKHEQFPHPSGVAGPVCADCHQEVATQEAQGVHGQARARGNAGAPDCGVCHGDAHSTLNPQSMAFRKTVPETCALCHDNVVKQYLGSVHGRALERGVVNAPLCTDCHGEHSILAPTNPKSSVYGSHIRETCGRCHGDVRLSQRYNLPADTVVSYEASYHGLASKAGSQTVANCASCHGIHNILPSSDPNSTINPDNLPSTCGKCHPGAGRRFAIGQIHWTESGQPPTGVRLVRDVYRTAIPLLIGLMFLHNLGDWIRKLLRLRLRAPALAGKTPIRARETSEISRGPEVRMYRFERIQHGLLIVSFVVLAWTGFALKYPDQWWARPLLQWESVFPVRATVHRIAGAVMIGLGLTHLISLFVNRRLHRHWQELWPRSADVREALLGFVYRLNLVDRRPPQSPHSYIEKAEYWAVVWGTAVMIVTGGMLWATDYMLTWVPKTWLDVATGIHFYEAVLATLAIVVWHFYSVIFDPEVYPMDTAWLTGLSVRKRESHNQRPAPSENPEGRSSS